MSKKNYDRKDYLHQQAKQDGYHSRAAYKLLELQTRAKIIPYKGVVLDLGCWPGGWLQVAAKFVGTKGVVVGIDLVKLEALKLPNVQTLVGDIYEDGVIALLQATAYNALYGEQQIKLDDADPTITYERVFDVVLSDMSPKLSGIKDADEARTESLAESARNIAQQVLKKTGVLVIKLFKSQTSAQFVKATKMSFKDVRSHELSSTRSTSKEFYLVCRGLVDL
jgi:23S rRNA (uridine2552-2'-O)-methyltransferase